MKKKAIICHCIDNFGKNYKFAIICDENKVEQTIREYESTEIVDFEILDAYLQEQ